MKRLIAIVLVGLLSLSAVACAGGSSDAPADLVGEWKQVNGDADSAQTATITADTIEVYWASDDTKALYWSGTFVAPTGGGKYTWDSKNDKSKTGGALLASGDDTKTFTFENGQLSFDVTMMSVTKTVRMEKQ